MYKAESCPWQEIRDWSTFWRGKGLAKAVGLSTSNVVLVR